MIACNIDVLETDGLGIVIAVRRSNLVPLNIWHLKEVLLLVKDDVRFLDNDGSGFDFGDRGRLMVYATVMIRLATCVTD